MAHRPVPVPPGPGQESVWDYPRPPRLEQTHAHIRILISGVLVADTRAALRVLETSHPPTYYLPFTDLTMHLFTATHRASVCEWKGAATYLTLTVAGHAFPDVAWTYPDPTPPFAPLKDHLALYASPILAAGGQVTVDGVPVEPQPGGFYGGWITPNIVGPFKGSPHSFGW